MNVTTLYRVKNNRFLTKILWSDAFLGGSTALNGLYFTGSLANWLGLSPNLIRTISIITAVYAVIAFRLAIQRPTSVWWLRMLVAANWGWTLVSIGLLFINAGKATTPGLIFLVLQILVVGGLAYIEGNQIIKM